MGVRSRVGMTRIESAEVAGSNKPSHGEIAHLRGVADLPTAPSNAIRAPQGTDRVQRRGTGITRSKVRPPGRSHRLLNSSTATGLFPAPINLICVRRLQQSSSTGRVRVQQMKFSRVRVRAFSRWVGTHRAAWKTGKAQGSYWCPWVAHGECDDENGARWRAVYRRAHW